MMQTVVDSTLTDVFRGITIVGFLLLASIAAVWLGGVLRRFHQRGIARVRADEERRNPKVQVTQSNVIVFPLERRHST